MAIDLNGINITKLNPQAERTEQQARESTQSEQRAPRDRVELSRDAHSLERLEKEIKASESFDQGKVEAISRAISEGNYPVNSQRIAEKFLELESQLY